MFRRSAAAAPSAASPPTETVLEISSEEYALHESLVDQLRKLDALPPAAADGEDSGPGSSAVRSVVPTPQTLTRYLRARKNDPVAAAAMLAATLRLPPSETPCPRCRDDPRSHSFYPIGPTRRGEPVAYSHYMVRDLNAADNVVHMRWMMDSLFSEDSLNRMVWVMDMQGFGVKHMSPSIAWRVLGLFADHYPERLGRAVVYDAPSIFYSLFSAVKKFADPTTVAKVVFIKHSAPNRRAQFKEVGIEGECLDKLLQEINEARDSQIMKSKNWWHVEALPPLTSPGRDLEFTQ